MSHTSDGKINKPVGVDSDIPQVLGISSKDVGSQQMNNAINRYSYYKPVNSPERGILVMTDQLFRDSLLPVYYRAVGDAPASGLWGYTKNSGPFRVLDFDGYDHYQFLVAVDIAGAFPSTINFDNCRIWVPITNHRANKWPAYLNLPSGTYYDYALIFVCTKGGTRKVFRSSKEGWQNYQVGIFFGDEMNVNQSAYEKFNAIGIQDYIVDIVAVVIPRNHPDKTDGFIEITSQMDYMVLPQSTVDGKIYYPIKKGVKITKPGPRNRWRIAAHDVGNQTDGTYVPEGTRVGAVLTAIRPNGAGVDLYYDPTGRPFQDFINQGGPGEKGGTIDEGSILVNGTFVRFDGAFHIEWYPFRGGTEKPVIINKPANAVVTESNGYTNIVFKNVNIVAGSSDYFNVDFYFVDPDWRG